MRGAGAAHAPSFPFRVLVVDDSSAQRKLVSHALKATNLGIEVRLADSAEMAMDMIRLSSYCIIFIDFNLSADDQQLNGPGLIKELRVNPESYGQDLVLVGMSTSIAKYEGLFMAAGAKAVIPKPLPQTNKLAEIVEALHKRQDAAALLEKKALLFPRSHPLPLLSLELLVPTICVALAVLLLFMPWPTLLISKAPSHLL